MAEAVVLTATNLAASAIHVPNLHISPFNIGIGCSVVTGSPTYKIEHTFENPLAPGFDPAAVQWFDHASIVGQTAAKDGNYAFPVRGIRLSVTSGSGAVRAVLLQAGIAGS